jgi:hypothetical protein
VAIGVRYSEGQAHLDGPYLCEATLHPFVRDVQEFGPICMGHYERRGSKPAESAVNLLSDAKNVIMRGYGGRITPYRNLGSFQERRITQQEMEKAGLTPANIWR